MHPLWSAAPETLDVAAARVRLAWYRLGRGEAEGALAALAGAGDGRADVRYLRGLANMHAGRAEAARADLEAAAKLEPKRIEPRQALGAALLESGDYAAAEKAFAASPTDELSQIGQALAEAQLGKTVDADARLQKLVEAKLVIAADAASTDLAALRRKLGKLVEAARAIPPKPLTPEGWLLRGQLLTDLGDPGNAETAFRAAVERAPGYADAWMALAANLEEHNPAGAKDAARRVLEISPDAIEAHGLLARIYGKERDTMRQSAELSRIRELGEHASASLEAAKMNASVTPH
jgi:tetratricopeptide (TPR) repeat protein